MPRAVALIVDKVARQSVGKDWSLYAALLAHWAEIVGPSYAEATTPVKVTFPLQPQQAQRSAGSLTIRLPKGLAMEFSFKSDLIRQRINGYFGYNAIARIVLEPGFGGKPPRPAAPVLPNEQELASLRANVMPVVDTDLREALLSFGEALLRGRERSLPAVDYPAIK